LEKKVKRDYKGLPCSSSRKRQGEKEKNPPASDDLEGERGALVFPPAAQGSILSLPWGEKQRSKNSETES